MTSDLELYLFASGTLGVGGATVPVPFFLVRHPQGDVVIDGGNPVAVARDAHRHWGALADYFEVEMTEAQHCAVQLRGLGVAPEAVRYVVQTHLHIDHTGALGHFPDATVLVQARELEAARAADPPAGSGYVRQDYERPEIDWQLLDGDFDVFGDGTIRLIQTPGHSAGHMSVLLELRRTGLVLLTADASDNAAQWEGRAHPRALFSREQANASIQALRELADELRPLIVFGHDSENWAGLRHSPNRYA